ncbi:MAG: hypothetical protein WAQ29_11335 [Nitrososphaeraceae archaeon]
MARSKQRLKSMSKNRKTRVATEDDIDMLLELAELYNTNYDFEAAEWFWGEYNREVTSFEEFRNRYPQGSKGAQLFERFTSKFELAGILIEYRFLDENLYFDRYGAGQTEWEGTKSVIYGIRNEWNDPRFRENFELLARKGSKWLENHPPKIKEE